MPRRVWPCDSNDISISIFEEEMSSQPLMMTDEEVSLWDNMGKEETGSV